MDRKVFPYFLVFFYSEVFWVSENYIIWFVIKPSFIVKFIINFHLIFDLIAKKKRIVEFLIYCHILNNTYKSASHVDVLIIQTHNRIISQINYIIVVRGECLVFCLYYYHINYNCHNSNNNNKNNNNNNNNNNNSESIVMLRR